MKKIISLLVVLLLTLGSNGQKLSADQETIKNTFFRFLLYYKKHERKFNSFKLYSGTGANHNPPYRINWNTGVKKYFAYLRKYVPYVGEAYIKAEIQHFKESEKYFAENSTEEIAAGFDYDRWAGGQEHIEYTYKWYTAPQNRYVVTINGTKARLQICSPSDADSSKPFCSFVPFVKEKGRWKMADNIYPEDD